MEKTKLFNLIMIMRTSDVDLRLYAINEMKKDSEKVESLIKKHIETEDIKEAAKELKKELLSCEEFTPDERKEILDTFKKAMKTELEGKNYLQVLLDDEVLSSMFTKEELEKMIAPSSYTGICSVLARELADKAEAKAKMMTEK